MRAEPNGHEQANDRSLAWARLAVALAALLGLGLLVDQAWSLSATYDEPTYLRVAARWWRTGQEAEITRMGSPLTFWKLQQVPALWLLDHLGHSDWIDDTVTHEPELLPWIRLSGFWIWLAGLALVAHWSRVLYGPKAMAAAAWVYTLSPNLLAHGALSTMETPIVATMTGACYAFWRYLQNRRRTDFLLSAAVAGLAFSCKFTAVLIPPLLGLAWLIDALHEDPSRWRKAVGQVVGGMALYTSLMLASNVLVTAGATTTLVVHPGEAHPSLAGRFRPGLDQVVTRVAETPIPQDWVGFATQMRHQRWGGSSYLLGERRSQGWWYYYAAALAVKAPLVLAGLVAFRVVLAGRSVADRRDVFLPVVILGFLGVTMLGSSRNYGVRYLLPLAPLAIVWLSGLAGQGRKGWIATLIGIVGLLCAVASVHPHELTYFNVMAGGRERDRLILADSNLDWGQGLKGLAALQRERPELCDLTFYYFGDTRPEVYGVRGTCFVIDAGAVHPDLPVQFSAKTRFVAVSASLQFGPWGPEGYFRALDGVPRHLWTPDTTIAIFRTKDIPSL